MFQLKEDYCQLTPENRIYKSKIPIIGLTGGIATGKSTASRYLRDKGFLIIDADEMVKNIYRLKKTIGFIATNFPDCVENSVINFIKLREVFFSDPRIQKSIENFIYKEMPKEFERQVATSAPSKCFFYDVPLLYEKKLDDKVDLTVCISTDPKIQLSRIIDRDNVDEELAKKIMLNQMPIEEKIKLSQVNIDNAQTISALEIKLNEFIANYFVE
jgi:dephospho-CoA kinase